MTPRARAPLHQVAQIGHVDAAEIAEAVREISSTDVGFKAQYAGFNDGQWLSAVVFNPSGREDHHLLVDGVGRPTQLAARLPRVAGMVDRLAASFGLEIAWARLALMKPHAEVWEHRDFLELRDQDKVRLHVPLITNPGASLHVPGASVHLATGYVWHIATDSPHAASNDGPARIHLIVDCNDAARLAERGRERWLDETHLRYHPALDAEALGAVASEFRNGIERGDADGAERRVLALFGRFDLGGTTTYRILSDLYRAAGADARAEHWLREETDKLFRRLA